MPIETIAYTDNDPTAFHVTERFEVYDGPTAIALDHLLNHLKIVLSSLDGRYEEAVRQSGRYAAYFEDFSAVGPLMFEDCFRLLKQVYAINRSKSHEERVALLDEIRSTIPFLDYQYPGQPLDADSDDTAPDATDLP